ncbi:MAG: GNAT family N-acetyltransferase, partial [Microcystis sp. M53599_WE4]|nr:GNAT family N-acetyltransferase [Microcystis sp. M53599_WE4]
MTTSPVPQGDDFSDRPIRPVQYRDLEDIEALTLDDFDEDIDRRAQNFRTQVQQVRPWFGLFKILSLFPNPLQHRFHVYVAESMANRGEERKIRGAIQVTPFNSSRSTWRVEQVRVHPAESLSEPKGIGA